MQREALGPDELILSGAKRDKKLNREPKTNTKSFLKNIGYFEDLYWDEARGKVVIETNNFHKFRQQKKKIFKETGWRPELKKSTNSGMVKKTREILYESANRFSFLKETGRKIHRKDQKKTDWLRLSFLGGCREVGKNSVLLQTNNSRILLDFGREMTDGEGPYHVPELDLNELDAIILSHSHLDHSGKIASLYSKGYQGPLYATEPTLALSRLIKKDSYKLAREKNNEIDYKSSDIDKMLEHSIAFSYNEKKKIAPNINLTFLDAGHLPGSAGILLEIGDKNLFYTGDFDTRNSKLLYPADFDLPQLDALIMESTYAFESLPNRKKVEKQLINIIKNTIERGGNPVISTFAIGRAQEIISIIESYGLEKNIYLDGMIREATKIISSYPSYLKNNFDFDVSHVYDNKDREKAILDEKGIILTTSGMLTGGAITYYLDKLERDKRSSLILPGYLAENTPAREIQNGNKKIKIGDREFKLDLKTHVLRFSSHPDNSDLWNFLHDVKGNPQTFIIHGEKDKTTRLAKSINTKLGWKAFSPRNLNAYKI